MTVAIERGAAALQHLGHGHERIGRVLRIEGRLGARMPLNQNPLNQNQITGIRAWIGEGALNN